MAYDKETMNTYLKARYYRMKKWAFGLLGDKCHSCGSMYRMQIDHIDPSQKEFDVTRGLRSRTKKVLLKEIAKCQLLCLTCHQEKTKKEKGNSREKNGSAKLRESDIPIIRGMLTEGLSLRRIAERFGVSHVSILDIKKRRTWI